MSWERDTCRGQESWSSLKEDAVLGSASVNMYAKCSVLEKACKILEEILERNIVLWNALIEGYV